MNTAVLLLLILLPAARVFAADHSAVEKGHHLYQEWCTPCHGPGLGRPGTSAATAHYKGSKPAVLEERTDLTAEMIQAAVRNGMFVMPRFRKTEISNAELEAIGAYLTRK